MYGKTDRIYLNDFWKFKKEINILKREGSKVVLSAESKGSPIHDAGLDKGGATARLRCLIVGGDPCALAVMEQRRLYA